MASDVEEVEEAVPEEAEEAEEVEEAELNTHRYKTVTEKTLIGAAGAALIKVSSTKTLKTLASPPKAEALSWRGADTVAYGVDNMSLWEENLNKNVMDPYTHRRYGRALEANGEMSEAVSHYKAALAIDPEYHFARRDLGVALASQGQRSSGLKQLQEVVKGDPNYAQAYCDIGDILCAERDWKGAIWHYECALSRDGDYHSTTTGNMPLASYKTSAYRGLGVANIALGESIKGVQYLREALEMCPEDRLTQYHLHLATGPDAPGIPMPLEAPEHESWRYENERELAMGHLMDNVMCDRPADMAAIYRRAHRKDPQDQFAALRLGAALYCKQDSSNAGRAHLL